MANLVRTFKKAAKTALNPVSSTKVAISMANPINTFKAVNNSATKNVAAALLNPNPVSNDKLAVARALVNPNPIKTTTQLMNVVSTTANPQSGTQKRVIPDRSSYSASAGAGASAAAANEAAAKKVEEYKNRFANVVRGKRTIVPDRASYSANASANEAVRNIAKTSNEIANNSNGMQTAEQQKDATNPEQVAERIVYMFPDDVSNMRYAAGATGADAMNEQYLPEIYIQSDYKKYLILGGFALLGIFIWKKIK